MRADDSQVVAENGVVGDGEADAGGGGGGLRAAEVEVGPLTACRGDCYPRWRWAWSPSGGVPRRGVVFRVPGHGVRHRVVSETLAWGRIEEVCI